MAFWSKWFARGERKYTSLDLFKEIYGGRVTSSGRTVTWSSALEVSTMLGICKVIAEGIAQVPWKLFVDTGTDIRKAQNEHPIYRLLYRSPNRWQTSFEFRETIAFHLVLKGNAYVFVGRVGMAREIRELVPLEPQYVIVEKTDAGDLRYVYRPLKGQQVTFSAENIWHIRGPSWNTWQGLDAVSLAREAISLAMAVETSHGEMHKNGSKTTGTYSVEGPLSPQKYDFLATWLDKYTMGGERVGKPMILDMGAKWLNQQMTGVDAQHLETRKLQIEEMCRAFRVMPLMLGHPADMAARAATESIFIHHVVHCLSPWYERLEQSADINLLTEEERQQGFYTKFIPNALMRGAAKDRGEFYKGALGGNGIPGWKTPNEIRALEDESPLADGNELYKPPEPAPPQDAPPQDQIVKQALSDFARAYLLQAEIQKTESERPAPTINVDARTEVHTPEIKVDVAATQVKVDAPQIEIHPPNVSVDVHIPKKGDVIKRITGYDDKGRYTEMTETEIDG